MNDQDYIRKAVELADGWKIHIHSDVDENAHPFETTIIWNPSVGSHRLCDPGQTILDALAAQLVRQVDALDDFSFSTDINRNAIVQKLDLHIPWLEGGPDRTMNIIKVVVDSKALEKQ